ncbi:hypothetical protein [uncultured Jatrophihabitans sp.]
MSTPDPRRGDEPGDPDVTPGQPNPNSGNAPNDPPPPDDDDAPNS